MSKERIQSIDGLRGFSLLGILLANMLHFQYNTNLESIIQDGSTLQKMAYYIIKIGAEGSFYPLFSFLFGFSLLQLVNSIQRRERRVMPVLIRRAIGLIVIGLIHYIFIWSGDILINYGIMLFILLLFVFSQAKIKLVFAILFSVISVLFMAVNYYFSNDGSTLALTEVTATILRDGTYAEVLRDRLLFKLPEGPFPYFIHVINFIMTSLLVPIALIPLALFGMYVAQKGYLNANQSTNNPSILRKYDGVLYLLLGLLLKCGLLLSSFWGYLLFACGALILTVGYIKLFILLYQAAFHPKLKLFFSSLGRISLSNYLLQSIICTTIFYGYAIGLFGQIGIAGGIIIALTLYIIQGLASYWYLKKFKQGPVEYILRLWSYLGREKRIEVSSQHQHHM